jgi:hypothetical protein
MTAVQDERAQYVAWSDIFEFGCLEENDSFRTTALVSGEETDRTIEGCPAMQETTKGIKW